MQTYGLLCELMNVSGDFLVRRVREDVLPALLSHLERALLEWSQLERTRRARTTRREVEQRSSKASPVDHLNISPVPIVLPVAHSSGTVVRTMNEEPPASRTIRDLDVIRSRVRRLVEAALTLLAALLRTVWLFLHYCNVYEIDLSRSLFIIKTGYV